MCIAIMAARNSGVSMMPGGSARTKRTAPLGVLLRKRMPAGSSSLELPSRVGRQLIPLCSHHVRGYSAGAPATAGLRHARFNTCFMGLILDLLHWAEVNTRVGCWG